MAPRVNQGVANEVLSESLGLNMDDLGANSLEDMENNLESDDDGEGDEDLDLNEPNEPQDLINDDDDDGLSVTHTRQQQRQPQNQNRQQQRQPNQQRQQQQPRNWNQSQLKTTMDKRGNILGPDGKVVAFAGREARLFNSHHQLRGDFTTLQTTAQNAQRDLTTRLNKAIEIGQNAVQQIQRLNSQGNFATEYGLNEAQIRESLAITKQSLTDPIGAIKTLLTRATARGIDLTTLGLQPGGFDTKSLLDLIKEEIKNGTKPVQDFNQRTQQTDQQRRELDQATNDAKAELQSFMANNPGAENYLHIFNAAFQNPDPAINRMSLGEIWARTQLNLMQRGIDPQAPPQQQQRSPNGQQRQQQQRGNPRLPNGRGNPSGGRNDGRQQEPSEELAPVDMTYEQILAGVLKDVG